MKDLKKAKPHKTNKLRIPGKLVVVGKVGGGGSATALPPLQGPGDRGAENDRERRGQHQDEFDDELSGRVREVRRRQEVRDGHHALEQRYSWLLLWPSASRVSILGEGEKHPSANNDKTYRHESKRLDPQIAPLPGIIPTPTLITTAFQTLRNTQRNTDADHKRRNNQTRNQHSQAPQEDNESPERCVEV